MDRHTRRRFVRVFGVTGVVGLAGCAGDDTNTDESETTESGETATPASSGESSPETSEETTTASSGESSEDSSSEQREATGDWPTFRADNQNTGHNPAATAPGEQPEVLWERDGFREAYPTVVDGTVYCGGKDSVRALNAETGETLWTYEVGAEVDAAPAVVDETVVFPDWDGSIHAVDAGDGSEVWVRSASSVTGEPIDGGNMVLETGAVTVANGTVYDGSRLRRQDSFFAFDLSTGETQFVIDSDPDDGEQEWESGVETFVSAPAIADGRAHLGAESGWQYAIDLASGEVAWGRELGVGYRGSSTVVDGTVYFASSGRAGAPPHLYAADASTGNTQWRYRIGPQDGNQEVRAATAFAHGAVLLGHSNGQLHAVEPDGTERWTVDTDGGVFAGATADSDRIYVGQFGGFVSAIDPESGDIVWTLGGLGRDIDTPPIPYEDTLYVNAERGPLSALRA